MKKADFTQGSKSDNDKKLIKKGNLRWHIIVKFIDENTS